MILLAAAVATAPILLHGSFCGDDFDFHVVSWFEAQQSWLHGIALSALDAERQLRGRRAEICLLPAADLDAGRGAGPGAALAVGSHRAGLSSSWPQPASPPARWPARPSPTPPQPWPAAPRSSPALLSSRPTNALPLPNSPAASGFPCCCYLLLRDRNPSAALWRRALDGSTLPLALVVAGCWLSNGPLGVMASYLLAAVALAAALAAAPGRRFCAPPLRAGLGIALAAFYLLPAAWEQRWADLRAAIDYPVFNIENNWLFARPTDPLLAPFGFFLHRASMLAVSMIAVALLGAMICWVRGGWGSWFPTHSPELREAGPLTSLRSAQDGRKDGARRWWIPLALIPAAVFFLQFPISLPVWNLLPKLRFLQYPWRWVLVVEAPMAIFFAAAVWPAARQSAGGRLLSPPSVRCSFFAATVFAARTFLRACKEGDYRGGLSGGLPRRRGL